MIHNKILSILVKNHPKSNDKTKNKNTTEERNRQKINSAKYIQFALIKTQTDILNKKSLKQCWEYWKNYIYHTPQGKADESWKPTLLLNHKCQNQQMENIKHHKELIKKDRKT